MTMLELGALVAAWVAGVVVLRHLNRDARARFYEDDDAWWYTNGDHREPTPKEWE